MKFSTTTLSTLLALWGVAAVPTSPLSDVSSTPLADDEKSVSPELALRDTPGQTPKKPDVSLLFLFLFFPFSHASSYILTILQVKCFVEGFAGGDIGLSRTVIKNVGEVEGLITVPSGGCWMISCFKNEAAVYMCNRNTKWLDVQPVHAVKAALEVHHWCSSTVPNAMTVQGEYFNNTGGWSIILGRRYVKDGLEVCRADLNHGL